MAKYKIVHARPGPNGVPVKNQGWRVYEYTYAKSHKNNPIKREKQVPYLKLIAVYATEDEARARAAQPE